MIKSIFVPLTGLDSDRAALQVATRLMREFGAQIDCMHARLDTKSASALAMHETTWRIEQSENERSAKARASFVEACKPYGFSCDTDAKGQASGIRWQEVEGIPLEEYLHHGRMTDVVVAGRETLLPEHCAELVMRTGRPVMIAPAKPAQVIGESVAFAWKDAPECARALTASMAFLLKAKKVLL